MHILTLESVWKFIYLDLVVSQWVQIEVLPLLAPQLESKLLNKCAEKVFVP